MCIRDSIWQEWALHACATHSLSFFYDGLNPRSGIGGESPFSPASMLQPDGPPDTRGLPFNNTGGLFLPGWTGVNSAKLHLLAQVPATRPGSLRRRRCQ